ncbi:MAG: YncE family protein, partial [Rhabdochlamydiaceae bacterium]
MGPDSTFFDQVNGLVYIPDSGIDAVSVVNATTGRLVATISLPEIIGNLRIYLYDSGNQELYIGSQESPEVFAIDTTKNYIVGELTTREPCQSLASMIYDPVNGKIFGINFVYSLVSVINDSTNNTIANIKGIQGPLSGIYDPTSNAILVNAYNGTSFAIDANNYEVVGTLPVNASVFLFDPDNKLLYASLGNSIIALNASTYQKVGTAFSLPNSYGNFVFYDSVNKDIYFYNIDNSELSAISTLNEATIANISVEGIDSGLALESPSFLLDSANGNIYATEVANPQSGTIALLLINGTTNEIVSRTFPSGLPLNYLSFDQSDGILYGVYGPYS